MGNALLGAAVQGNARHGQQACAQVSCQLLKALVLAVARLAGQGKGTAHARYLMGRQGAGTQALLMAAAVHLRTHQHAGARPDIQRADAFRPVDLVRRKRHQVHGHRTQVDSQLAHGLRGIHVQQGTVGTHLLADRGKIGDRAQFVVDRHQRYQAGVSAQCCLHTRGLNQASGIRCQARNGPALTFQLGHGVEHGLVFQLAGDQVPGLADALGNTLERQVVGLGRPRCPHQMLGLRTDALGHLLTGLLYGVTCSLAEGVPAGRRVAEVGLASQAGEHGFDDPVVNRGCGGVIEVEWGARH